MPPVSLPQDQVRDLFASQPGITRLSQRLVRATFDASAIEQRATVLPELAGDGGGTGPVGFYDPSSGRILAPSTGHRNAVYAEEARPLLARAAKQALREAPGLDRADVTHVVTVSCTGFFAPGPDYTLVRDLGLAPSTRRLHVGFMGCYGAFPALRAAVATCAAEPDAVVLVVCVELCTLHLRSSDDPDQIVASSVFADGAAAAVVTARPAPAGTAVLDVDALEIVLTDDGEGDMAWTIGDLGFEMVLSRYVPKILQARISEALQPLRDRLPAGRSGWDDVQGWAVHPGGRAILDRVQRALELPDAALAPSRAVLRDHGNMSSATVLFILRRLLHADDADDTGPASEQPQRIVAMAFGPGLTVESALLTRRVTA